MNFTLTERDSWEFARLSGDFNPLHVDPIAARRLQFGGTVCHGVHLVLKALDLAAAAGLLAPERIDGISAVFGASVRTGTPVSLDLPAEAGATQVRLVASTEGRPLFTAKLSLADAAPAAPPPSDAEPDALHAPLCPEFPAAQPMPALADQVPLRANSALMLALFPHLAGSAQGGRIAADLLATTRIVGMRCPGLHSIYSELKLRRRAPSAQIVGTAMHYAVNRADERFRSVRIGVTGAALEGTLDAFFRAPPVAQPLLAELRLRVGAHRFADQHALVVGGSRGLGELVAKLLLAGGAKVALTYAHGQVDAERICREAADHGLEACAWHLDASRPLPAKQVSELRAAGFSHVYHFATPKIAKSPSGRWSQTLFSEYCEFYVRSFADVVHAAAPSAATAAPLRALFPSTVFLDPPAKGFAEYCAAKAAGEALCDHLAMEPGLLIHRPRLPRLQTDQNASFRGVEGEAPLPVMLGLLEALHPLDEPGRKA